MPEGSGRLRPAGRFERPYCVRLHDRTVGVWVGGRNWAGDSGIRGLVLMESDYTSRELVES